MSRSDLIEALDRVTRRLAAGESGPGRAAGAATGAGRTTSGAGAQLAPASLPVTAAQLAADEEAAQLLDESGWTVESQGRTTLSRSTGLVVGLDLGGTKLRGLVGDAAGSILYELEEPTVNTAPDAAVGQIAAMTTALAARAGIVPRQLAAVAVGVPGVVTADGHIAHSPNVTFSDTMPIGVVLARLLGTSVVVENDGNLSAYGEFATRKVTNPALAHLAFLALGTGIGMGLISNGELLRGVGGAAGEIAFLPFGRDPFAAAAEEPGGAYEAAVGSVALSSAYELATGRMHRVHEIFALAESGDETARSVVARLVDDLALGVGAVVALLDPGLVVLGGGIGARPDLGAAVAKRLAKLVPNRVDVVPSTLGDRAGVIGALAFALQAARRRLIAGETGIDGERASA